MSRPCRHHGECESRPRWSVCLELHVETRDDDFVRSKFSDLKVDVLLISNLLFDEVRKRYTTVQRFVEQEIRCATVEGLILLKLYALPSRYRQGNFTRAGLYENDVATLLHAHHSNRSLTSGLST